MRETIGELFELDVEAIAITVNGYIKQDGRAVMGRGCADQARRIFPGIDLVLGRKIANYGNRVHCLGQRRNFEAIYKPDQWIVSFPVKNFWWEDAVLELIVASAEDLRDMADRQKWKSVGLPRPGCGNGRLEWSAVKPRLSKILDDRFVVTTI